MKITKILEKGNCGRVTDRGQEACIKAVSSRTETSYKAESLGKGAQHSEALSLGDTVDDGIVQLEFTLLSGEIPIPNRNGEVSRRHSTASALAGRPEHEGRQESLRCEESSVKPNGGDESLSKQDKLESRNDLLECILSRENMLKAWKRVKANKGSSGIDEMTVEEFPEFARHNWEHIRLSLMKGTYTPKAVRRVEIPKPTGGKRPLGIPSVLDRVIQQATAQVLGPLFEPVFSQNSYGFRPQRSAHQAIRAVQKAVQNGYTIAVDADLSKFFDTVNHDVLMRLLSVRVRDKRVMRLIVRYLHAGVSINGNVEATTQGVPQGGPLSPLLANIVLNELDKELEQRGHRFVRYADDFIVMVKSQSAGERVFGSIRNFIEKRLHLHVNETKSKVAPIGECRFLGFRVHRKRIRWDPDVEREFKRRIRVLTSRSWGVSMEVRLLKLSQYIRGWVNYFGISEYYTPIPKMDGWLRRRMRLCYWKMWKKPRKRMSELMKLGTNRKEAILAGRSRKGYWRLSRTLATQSGMTDAWLASQGLLSIKELWVAIHYPSSDG